MKYIVIILIIKGVKKISRISIFISRKKVVNHIRFDPDIYISKL